MDVTIQSDNLCFAIQLLRNGNIHYHLLITYNMVIFNYLNVISVKIQITYIFSSKKRFISQRIMAEHMKLTLNTIIIDVNIIFCIFLVNMC